MIISFQFCWEICSQRTFKAMIEMSETQSVLHEIKVSLNKRPVCFQYLFNIRIVSQWIN